MGESPTTAAIYCRISSDPTGQAAGVERQRQDCEALAASLGLTVADVHIDNDISAYSGVPRPAFEALLTAAQAGHYAHVIVWHPDRLYRRLADLLRITEALKRCEIHTVTAGRVDLSTPAGRLQANLLGAIGQHESEHRGERVARQARQRAENGRMTAANRPRGWRWIDPCPGGKSCRHRTPCTPGQRARIGSRSGLTIDHDEAEILRQAYADIAGGRSMLATWRRAAAAGLSAAGPASLREMLLNPRNAGLVAHKGVVVASAADGLRIVEPELFDQVVAILRDPRRRTSPGRPAGTPLGGGLALCPRCEGPLAAGRKPDGNNPEKVNTYVCSRHLHFSRRRRLLDAPVLAVAGDVLEALADSGLLVGLTARQAEADPLREEISTLERQLDELAGLLGAGDLDATSYAAGVRALRARLEAATASLARRSGKPALVSLAGDAGGEGVRAAFDALVAGEDTEKLRAVLRELFVAIRPQLDGTTHLQWVPELDAPVTVLGVQRTPRPGTEDRREQVAALWQAGRSQLEIAAELGLSRNTVRADLRALGLRDERRRNPIAGPPVIGRLPQHERRARVRELFDDGASITAISDHLGVHRGTVRADLKATEENCD